MIDAEPMDADGLKQLSEALDSALNQEGKPWFELQVQLRRLMSHLESEQRVTVRMEKQMDQIEKRMDQQDTVLFGDRIDPEKNPGLVAVYNEIRQGHKRNQKILWVVLASVLAPLVVNFAPQLFKLINP